MNQLKNYTIIVLASFLLIIAAGYKIQRNKIKAQKIEIARVTDNYQVLQDSFKLVKGRDGLNAYRIRSQELTIAEMRAYYQNLIRDVSDMKISLRKVASITAFNTETTNNVNTFFKDSTRINNVPIETLSYHSRWFDIDICKEGLKANINHVSRDSIVQVVHWNYTGKFWLTRFLTKKEYTQDIKSLNPDSKIKYPLWIYPIKK